MTIHVVRPGDSVDSVAAYYGVDPIRLASDNSIPDNGALAILVRIEAHNSYVDFLRSLN